MNMFWSLLDHAVPLAQLISTIGTIVVCVQSYRNGRNIRAQAGNIQKIETATNSMKDELVKVTGDARYAEGLKHGQES